jgi:hypothetical protein
MSPNIKPGVEYSNALSAMIAKTTSTNALLPPNLLGAPQNHNANQHRTGKALTAH